MSEFGTKGKLTKEPTPFDDFDREGLLDSLDKYITTLKSKKDLDKEEPSDTPTTLPDTEEETAPKSRFAERRLFYSKKLRDLLAPHYYGWLTTGFGTKEDKIKRTHDTKGTPSHEVVSEFSETDDEDDTLLDKKPSYPKLGSLPGDDLGLRFDFARRHDHALSFPEFTPPYHDEPRKIDAVPSPHTEPYRFLTSESEHWPFSKSEGKDTGSLAEMSAIFEKFTLPTAATIDIPDKRPLTTGPSFSFIPPLDSDYALHDDTPIETGKTPSESMKLKSLVEMKEMLKDAHDTYIAFDTERRAADLKEREERYKKERAEHEARLEKEREEKEEHLKRLKKEREKKAKEKKKLEKSEKKESQT